MWGFLHLPTKLPRARLWSSSSVFPAPCGNSHPVWTRMLMDQDVCGQGLRDQAGSCWPGTSQCLCPFFNSNKSRYFRVLESHVSYLKASPLRPRASGQIFEGFCGQTAHHFLLQEKQQQDWTKSVLKHLLYNRGHFLHHVALNETKPQPQHEPYTAPRHKALVFYFSAVYLPLNSEKYYL